MAVIGEKKDIAKKITKAPIVVGIDLTDAFSQVSYWELGSGEPETVSTVLGSQQMCIPTVLGKFYGDSTWTFGKEAQLMEEKNEGFLISSLVELARKGELVEVETRDYDPVDLLALFIKKCLGLISMKAPLEKVSMIMITVEEPDVKMIQILNQAVSTLRIKPEKVCFQSHSESAYNYMIHQAVELWSHDVLICHLREDGLLVRTMKKNIHTSPIVVLMEEKWIPSFKAEKMQGAGPAKKQKKDLEFCEIIKGFCEGNMVSSIYLLGDGFDGEWCEESLKYMCRNRRVFQGNNLFSKGACYGAKEKIEEPADVGKHVFLGKDKVKSNVGMRVTREGEDSYMVLLDAGKNWYETSKECELILDREDTVSFLITPLNGKNERTVSIYLRGCPVRPPKATRVHLEMKMMSERRLHVCIRDLGFGELFPSSGMMWQQEFVVD